MDNKDAARFEILEPGNDPRSGSSLVPMLVIGLVLMIIGVIFAFLVAVG